MVYFPFYFLAFAFGAVIGSFLNVVILRYNTGLTIGGRSRCFSCSRELTWTDLVPILSFLVLRGKCRRCGSRISWQYPIVEALTGVTFLGIFFQLQENFFQFFVNGDIKLLILSFLIPFIFYAIIWSVLIVILVYDIRHTIIPDALAYSFAFLSLLQLYLFYRGGIPVTLWDVLAGPILFTFFFLLWFVSGGRWMGFGDAKLAVGIGLLLGFSGGISAVTFAFWIGSVVAIFMLLLQHILAGKTHLLIAGKELTIRSEIPFAPFLIIGVALVFFFHLNLAHVLSLQ